MTTPETHPLTRLALAHDPPILTRSALAELAKVDKSAITRLYDGKAGELVRIKVAGVFGLSVDKLDAHLTGRVDLVTNAVIKEQAA